MKRIIILLVLFTILCLLITATLVILKKEEQKKSVKEVEVVTNPSGKVQLYKEYHLPIQDDVVGATPSQVYDTNPIKFIRHRYEDEKMICYYFEIDGLLDKKIEQSINDRLKNKIIEYGNSAYLVTRDYYDREQKGLTDEYERPKFSVYDSNEDYYDTEKGSDWKVLVTEKIMFNGANALSIRLSEFDDYYLFSRFDYININLVNGKDIKIEELFNSDISVKEIYYQGIYSNFGDGEIIYDDYETWTDSDGVTHKFGVGNGRYTEIDIDAINRLVNKIRYTEDIKFGFSDRMIIINNGDDEKAVGEVFLADIANHVALFNRFKTDKRIYDNKYNKLVNVPVFCGISRGDKVKYARYFEKEGNVILNYQIEYNGDYESEDKYKYILDYAIDRINDYVKSDIDKLNQIYSGQDKLLFSGVFDVQMLDVGLKEKDKKYSDYINIGNKYMKFSYDPNVYEVSEKDIELIKSNYNQNINYDYTHISYMDSVWKTIESEWTEIKRFTLNRYDKYYEEVRANFYTKVVDSWEDSYYYDNIYDDWYLMGNKIQITKFDNFKDVIIKDEDGLAHLVFEQSPEIWDYNQINENVYNIDIYDYNDSIVIRFPYYRSESYWSGWTDVSTYINYNKIEREDSARNPKDNMEYGYI